MIQPILDYKDILSKAETTLDSLRELFETQGFAFIQFPEEAAAHVDKTMARLEAYLRNPPRDQYQGLGKLGFQNTKVKTSFSCPTGSELDGFLERNLSDEEVRANFARPFALQLDEYLEKIVDVTSSPFFGGKTPEQLGKELDVAFLDKSSNAASFALFDVAFYKNHEIYQVKEGGNCVEHYDPGLYSLWVGETQPGLKLRDAENCWIPPPIESGVFVLWLCEAASDANPKFVPAMHRVDQPNSSTGTPAAAAAPRLSVWTELCTREQILENKSAKFASASVIEVKNAFGGGGEPYRVRVENGDIGKA